MARIRSKSAVVDFGKLRLSGFIAWLLWGLVQVYWSFFRNRGRRDNGWLRSYMTVERVARLIASQTHLRTDGTAATAARGPMCLAPGKSSQGTTGSAQPVPATDRPPVVENGGRRRDRTELPNLITAPAAMATCTEIRSQSRAARKIAMRGSVS
jgi:hypothetical protein